jgi:hypothetical protein
MRPPSMTGVPSRLIKAAANEIGGGAGLRCRYLSLASRARSRCTIPPASIAFDVSLDEPRQLSGFARRDRAGGDGH